MTFTVTLFDYNGVLVDDEAVHLEAFRDALRPMGVPVAEAAYWDRYIGFDDREGFAAMLQDAGRPAPPELVEELIRAKRPLYLARAERELKSFPGAAQLVRERALRGPVLVVSGALRDEIRLGLTKLAVGDCVQHVVAAEDTSASKPDPEGYELALAWLGEHGHRDVQRETVVIEDSLAGIAAAKAAGLSCIAVGHSYPLDKLEASGADLVVPELRCIDGAVLAKLYAETR
ncbi:MAG TPA: HAD family phosphatase [Polyangiaceae bacterium]|nr:HAD family phosphatase [Polyangiaceae bacterium]